MRLCFYAAVSDPALFEIVEFYRQDIEILRSLGHEVRCASRPQQLRGDWDLAWVWWQTSGCPAVICARWRGRPAVLATALSDNDPSDSGMGPKSLPVRGLARVGLAAATIVLPCSEDTLRGLRRYRTQELRTIPLGVDVVRYCPGAEPRDPMPTILTISHLTADNLTRKRLLDVVRTAAYLPSVRVKIAGRLADGASALQTEIALLGLESRVTLLGSVSPDEKLRLLREAHVYLQPTQYEAFGVAIAEAMACGTPVVSSAVGNVPALVDDTGTLVADHAGPEDFADAVRACLSLGPEAGARARVRIEKLYSTDIRREAVTAVLADVMRPRSPWWARRGSRNRPQPR